MANATPYLTLAGHVLVAWMWLRQARIAATGLPRASAGEADYYQGKLHACDFFFRHELPGVLASVPMLRALDDTALAMTSARF